MKAGFELLARNAIGARKDHARAMLESGLNSGWNEHFAFRLGGITPEITYCGRSTSDLPVAPRWNSVS